MPLSLPSTLYIKKYHRALAKIKKPCTLYKKAYYKNHYYFLLKVKWYSEKYGDEAVNKNKSGESSNEVGEKGRIKLEQVKKPEDKQQAEKGVMKGREQQDAQGARKPAGPLSKEKQNPRPAGEEQKEKQSDVRSRDSSLLKSTGSVSKDSMRTAETTSLDASFTSSVASSKQTVDGKAETMKKPGNVIRKDATASKESAGSTSSALDSKSLETSQKNSMDEKTSLKTTGSASDKSEPSSKVKSPVKIKTGKLLKDRPCLYYLAYFKECKCLFYILEIHC